MGHDDPARRASRRLFETAYTKSPYRFTIIGYPDIYNELKPMDIEEYYRLRYAPNNVFYVVTGDVKTDEVVSQIRAAYSSTRAKAILPPIVLEEPRQTAPREIIEEAAIEIGHAHLSWHTPELRHPDVPLLDVLAVILGGGRSSRLYREVRENQGLVTSIDAWTYSPGSAGLFGISFVSEAARFAAARDAALEVVERLKEHPVTAAELDKAVKQFISGTLSSRKTMQGQAQDLGGSWLAANDLNFSQRFLDAVKKTTPGDLQRVARHYLTGTNRTVYALLPAGAAPKLAAPASVEEDRPIQKFEMAEGLHLLVKENHRLPFVEFRVVFKGGVLAETVENNGITQLMGKLLLKGTKTRTAEQIAEEIESLGGSLDSFGGNNSFGVSAEVMRQDFAAGLGLVADVLLNPVFPAAAIEREREIQLAGIRSQRDNLLKTASTAMRRAMFGEIGYGLDSQGREASVQALSASALAAFHERFVTPNNCVLAIYGDVTAAEVREAVGKAFEHWKPGGKALAHLPKPQPLNEIIRVVEQRDKKQAVLLVGFPGTSMHNPDRYALELLQEACSDLGSRLFLRIREKLGLAYYVGAQNFLGMLPGYFAFYAGTAPEKADLVERELLIEAELLREAGLTAEELKRAKAKIIGQRKIGRQDLGGLAMTTALDELYGLGFNQSELDDARYEAVTQEEVTAAARKYLRADAMVISLVRPS